MHSYRTFFDPITDLKQEETKSELQRSLLMIVLFSLLLIASIINFFLIDRTLATFYGGEIVFYTIVSWVMAFLAYQVLVILYLRRKLQLNRRTTLTFKIIHTLIEAAFPSALILYILITLKIIAFLHAPVALAYFLFIIVSVLHLDYKVSLFTGGVAAILYSALAYYGYHYVDVSEKYAASNPENSHYLQALILIFAGGAAAFVAVDLKSRIKSTHDYLKAKNELELVFGQQVSREVSQVLMEGKGVTKRLEGTVMFLDIRNFTAFADTHTPDQVVDYQNKFLGPVIDIINQHQGVVFQILGDGLMACFGLPVENVLHAEVAFQASIGILKCIEEGSASGAIPPTNIGIGLHSGLMVAGNIGNEQRKQFSISGTPVIIASRIEQLNKKYGTRFLISGEVYSRITPGKYAINYLGEEPLRGFESPIGIYSVVEERF